MKKIILLISFAFLILLSLNISADELPSKKISFEFADAPLSRILNAICRVNEMNLLFDSTNDKNIAITFDNVETKKAIEILAIQNNLDYLYKDNILIIDTKERIEIVYSDGPVTVPGPTNLLIDESKNDVAALIIDQEATDPGYRIFEGINKGVLIPAKLELGLISKQTPAVVKVMKNISYNGEIVIPKGATFTGKGIADYEARVIFVILDTLSIGNKEIDIQAHMVKQDGTPGFCSEYRDLEMEKFWPSFLLNFAGIIGNGLKDKLYITDSEGNTQPVEADTLKNDLIDRTQDGINGWTNQLMSDAKENNAIITVDPGIEGFVFIDEKISVDILTK